MKLSKFNIFSAKDRLWSPWEYFKMTLSDYKSVMSDVLLFIIVVLFVSGVAFGFTWFVIGVAERQACKGNTTPQVRVCTAAGQQGCKSVPTADIVEQNGCVVGKGFKFCGTYTISDIAGCKEHE